MSNCRTTLPEYGWSPAGFCICFWIRVSSTVAILLATCVVRCRLPPNKCHIPDYRRTKQTLHRSISTFSSRIPGVSTGVVGRFASTCRRQFERSFTICRTSCPLGFERLQQRNFLLVRMSSMQYHPVRSSCDSLCLKQVIEFATDSTCDLRLYVGNSRAQNLTRHLSKHESMGRHRVISTKLAWLQQKTREGATRG